MGHVRLSRRPEGGPIDIDVLKRKSWRGVAAEFVRIAAPATFDFCIKDTENCILLYDLYRNDGETVLSPLASSQTKDLRNRLIFVPQGYELCGWCSIDRAGAILAITVSQIKPSADELEDSEQTLPRMEFQDHALHWLLSRFRSILDDPSLDLPGYAEALAELLLIELRRGTSRSQIRHPDHGGLSARQMERILHYVDGHLAERMTIAELAALVELTPFQFIRSFKKRTGIPPYQFLIRKRIERAQDMLRSHDASVADVAAATGFGSPLQLTRAFRRILGTTPSDFRRDVA